MRKGSLWEMLRKRTEARVRSSAGERGAPTNSADEGIGEQPVFPHAKTADTAEHQAKSHV
jgi:hypothetical protein